MRLYCVGDVHGDMESFRMVLRENKIVDRGLDWIAGNSILIQMGDVLDGLARNSTQFHSASIDLDILKFLLKLRGQARTSGGDVRCLLGNHELMNLAGIYTYVAPNDLNSRQDTKMVYDLIASICEPWVVYDKFLFCHAGVSPHQNGITAKILQDLKTNLMNLNGNDLISDKRLAANEGITTTRYYHGNDQDNAEVRQLLNGLGIDRMFIGHNYVSKSIATRCLGRVVLTDTGISRAMGTDRNSEIVMIEDDMVYAYRKGISRPI